MNLIICEIMVSNKEEVKQITGEKIIWFFYLEGGGVREVATPLSNFKIKQSKKIEDNTLEKEEEKQSCMFVYASCVDTFFSLPPPPLWKFLDPRLEIQSWNKKKYDKHEHTKINQHIFMLDGTPTPILHKNNLVTWYLS